MNKNNKIAVFISHSHKDIEKIRKIRDILETLGCEPLMFYLKCLDDDNSELEDFIMREISARNIFLYCKSQNSENSVWVQKELAYIKQLDTSRLYTVDIDNDFEIGLISVLNDIMNMIKKNKIIFYCAPDQMHIVQNIGEKLQKKGYDVKLFDHPITQIRNTPSMKNMPVYEYNKIKTQIETYLEREIFPLINVLINESIFVPILSPSLSDGEWSTLYVSKFLSFIRHANNSDIFSIYVDMGKDYFHQLNEQNSLLLMSDDLNEEKIEAIASAIMNLSK
jgi:hypothetical protein